MISSCVVHFPLSNKPQFVLSSRLESFHAIPRVSNIPAGDRKNKNAN